MKKVYGVNPAFLSGLLATTALSGLLLTTAARAQTADNVITEVVVTAQRRQENIQTVPISVSAVTGETLAKANVINIQSLPQLVPGLVITGSAGVNQSNLMSIRGVSGQANAIGQSQTVAVYMDGQYLPRPDAAFFALDDVERVEVLRGPQGTLYGRNATGGAINIITRLPTDTVRGGFDASIGNFRQVSMKGSISGPIAHGLSGGLSGSWTDRDGFVHNTVTNSRVGYYDSYTLRGTLRYQTDDAKWDVVLTGDISRVEDLPIFVNLYPTATSPLTYPSNPWSTTIDTVSLSRIGSVVKSSGGGLTINYDLNDHVKLVSQTSGRMFETVIADDFDGGNNTFRGDIVSASKNNMNTFNQEFRSIISSDKVDAVLGVNYYYEHQTVGSAGFYANIIRPFASPFDESKVDAYAAFGQVKYKFTDQWSLVGGLRYNYEKRDALVDYSQASNPIVGTPLVGGVKVSAKLSDSVILPMASLNFQATPDILYYATFSEGYQAPGFNSGLANPTRDTAPATFDAEHMKAYEIGMKSRLFDRRMIFNVAAFYYDYSNLQVRTILAVGEPLRIVNAGSATIWGLEGESTVVLGHGFTLNGNLSYLQARYDRFCEPLGAGTVANGAPVGPPSCAAGQADRHGFYLINAPKWQGGVGLSYNRPIGSSELNANVSYAYQSNSFFTASNEPVLSTGSVDRVNAQVAIRAPTGAEFYVYGRNLTNSWYVDFAQRGTPTFVLAHISDPRTYGVGMRYHF